VTTNTTFTKSLTVNVVEDTLTSTNICTFEVRSTLTTRREKMTESLNSSIPRSQGILGYRSNELRPLWLAHRPVEKLPSDPLTGDCIKLVDPTNMKLGDRL
jgi:hypothetical protein